jgi:hypothetical protein
MINSKVRLGRNEVEAIPSPEYTKTWHPISHKEVLGALTTVVEAAGVGVVSESYSVKNNGRNLFGTWALDMALGNGSLVQLGFRNSLMKTFAVGVAAGVGVIACSNMQFNGEFLEFRKHTSGLDFDELLITANAAFSKVMVQSMELHNWQESLRETALPAADFKALTFDAMKAGIVAPNRFRHFIESHEDEIELYKGEDSLYQFHGAATRLNRDNNLFTIGYRTADLKVLCDGYTEGLAA